MSDMADSGQAEAEGAPGTQQTASKECDKLVCAILEMQMDMDVKRIDNSCFKLYFANILRDLPFLTPEVGAERLRKFMSMLENHYSLGQSLAIGRPDAAALGPR